jgi:multidrug efflux pump subunit AcrA (membrane-fusion protein)
LKSRLETTILSCISRTGAKVSEGATCCSRSISARSTPRSSRPKACSPGTRRSSRGAQRDVRRYSDLIGKGATTQVILDNAKTQADILIGTIRADQSALDNLKVQKSYTTIRAPFSGRISAANVKVGNFVRPADTAPLAVINQMAPVYVTFAIPQRVLVDLREAMAVGESSVVATIPGPSAIRAGQGRDGREFSGLRPPAW